jgi:hypothetical protein
MAFTGQKRHFTARMAEECLQKQQKRHAGTTINDQVQDDEAREST